MADALQEMSVFSRVVVSGSLSAAARELGISPALISRRLAALESRLGVRLINRTTRSLSLTVEGTRYLDVCTRVLAEIEEAHAELSVGRVEPQGALKVALPASFGHQHVAPLVPQFATRYPKVELALSLSDRPVNVMDDGFDVAVCIAELADSSLTARKLAPNRRVVCASPSYLALHGTPRTPEDLRRHNCLTSTDFAATWDYKGRDGGAGSVRVHGRHGCDNWELLREGALAGRGIALKSTGDVYRQLADGWLVALLPDCAFLSE